MSFPKKVQEKALVLSNRSCCICHKFCGTKIELHHIKQHADGGEDTFENCIPLCFDCHADMGKADPRHPKGKHYSEDELRMHRDNWYRANNPDFSNDLHENEWQEIWNSKLNGNNECTFLKKEILTEIIKRLSEKEVNLFSKIIPLVIRQGNLYFITSEDKLLQKYNTCVGELLLLDKAGLVSVKTNLIGNHRISAGEEMCNFFNEAYTMVLRNESNQEMNLKFGVYILTDDGIALYNNLKVTSNGDFYNEWADLFYLENNKMELRCSIHGRKGDAYDAVPVRYLSR